MPRFKTLQTRFTQGEIDPLMIGRVDVDQYYGAAATLRNVLTLPQGGVRRRPGLEYIFRVPGILTLATPSAATAPNGGTEANGYDDDPANVVLTTTNLTTTTNYVVLREDLGSLKALAVVYLNALKLSASGTSSEFFVQVSTDDVVWVTVGDAMTITDAAKDFSRRVHGTYRYVRLVRVGTTDLGTRKVSLGDMLVYSEGALGNTKLVNFEFNVSQTYVFVFSDKNIAVFQNGSYLIDIRNPDFTSAKLAAIDWVQNGDTMLVFHEDIQTIEIQRLTDNDIWDISDVSYTDIPQHDFGSGDEDIWSSSRGWPRHAAFYQGRMYVDGGKSRPTLVYGSVVNSPFSFDFGTGLADEAIGPLSFEGYNNVEAIYAGRALMIFTSGAEFVIPQPLQDPITPDNVAVSRQSSIGSQSYLRPQETEGGVLYVQRQGKSIQEFVFDNKQDSFANNVVSLISSHLVVSPVDFSLRKATNTEDGSYLLMVLGDGTLTVVNILRNQGINAFTSQNTTGTFLNCCSDIGDMYFVIKRTINGSDVQYLERFNNDAYMDCSTLFEPGSPTDTFNVPQLIASECRVLADGSVMENQTPDASGDVTIERNASDTAEVGLNFDPTITDLPVENSTLGTVLGMLVNISEIVLRLDTTAGIIVNGKTVSFRGFGPAGGGSPLDSTPPSFTGVKVMKGWRGWTDGGQVTITQEDPLPMKILALSKRVNV